MSAELGHFALILALALALAQSAIPFAGALRRDPRLMAVAGPAAVTQFLLIGIAFAALVQAYVLSDFSVLNVVENSHSAKPLLFKITGVWGNHEGSMLLWVLILALFGALVAAFGGNLPDRLKALVLSVQAWVAVAFLLFILFTSNPFVRLSPPPIEGQDLNPVLQDIGLAIHPPLLYLGYVGCSISFAFAIAALIDGRIDAAWARWVRPWTLTAWMFLTLGIAMGSYWAYYELGWGGFWFWDPVENASFMPWLAATALLHSAIVMEKRNALRIWTVLLSILAFSLSLLGTFLVRSGVLSSVHAFATDPERGIFILAFLMVVVGGSLLLFAWRGPRVGVGGAFEPVSREGMLLANNVLLMVASAAVLLGTLYPLVLDALNLGKISVGPAYFNTVFVPLIAPALFLMGVGPVARWKKASLPELALRLRWAAAVSLVTAVVTPFAFGDFTPLVGFGLFLAAWILLTALVAVHDRVQGLPLAQWGPRLRKQGGSWYGMILAHAGVGVFVVGVTLVGGYETEQDLRMEVGSTASAGGYDFRLVELRDVQGPNYDAVRATFELSKGGRVIKSIHPEKRSYHRSSMPMTEVALERGFTRDLYVSLGEPLQDGAWAVRIYVKPFVNWIWGGCVLMALGGLLAVADRRYRLRARAAQPLPRGAAAA